MRDNSREEKGMVRKVKISRFNKDVKGQLITEEFKNVKQIWFGKDTIYIETNKCVYSRELSKINDMVFNLKEA